MSERRAATKGRRLGSSRRRQVREGSGETPATTPGPGEEPSQAAEIVQRVQDFLREQHKDQEGFITRSDVQKFQEEGFPCSTEELELVFDGLDAAGTGRLSTEEFTAGLRQFLSSQKAAREHRRRKTAPRRVRLVLPIPALEGADSEEQRHFAAFMDQLGTNDVSEEQEIWQLWVKLRQDEPQLLGNLEDFLAKMRHRIQESRSKKEALEVALNKRVAEHDKEEHKLCEVLEQQIQQEQQRLEQKSMARSQQHVVELQRVLDASEREVQRLVTAQMELERRCRSLRSTQQVTSTENRELEESNRVLEDHLQQLHQQLEQTQGHLRKMRATVAWEHVEEPGDRAVAELPGEMPMSPQSPGASEKFRSEMRIRLGSQSREGKARNSHQVVWEMLPEISISGASQRVSSAEEDPFPEFLKEERFSDQSSLLREMNDAIAALSKHLKAQAPDAPLALADTSSHPQDDAEPQVGPEAATAHGTTPGILQEPLPGHISHELFEGDLKEGAATAELRALDVTQAGGSVGDGHHTALEPGAEQGQSPEEAQGMSFLQGKGAGVKEMVLKVAEHLGESKEAGEQAGMEVEGAGWMQEKTGWEKAQLLGEAEEAGIRQGESLEAGLEPPEAGQAVGQCLAMEELEPGAPPGECGQALGMALQEWADPALGLSEKLEIELGEHLEPEPPSWGQVPMGAAQRDSVLPEVTVAADPGALEEERVSAQGDPSGAKVLPAPAGHGMSSRDRGEEEEREETQPREADVQLQGEPEREDSGQGGSTGAAVALAVAVPPPDAQKGAAGADVELLEAQNSDTNIQLLAEREADLQASGKAGSPGTEQGGRLDPDVQPLNKDNKVEGLEVEAKDAQADVLLHGVLNPGALWGEEGGTAIQAEEEEEEGGQEQGECELPQEPVLDVEGAAVGQKEEAGEDRQPEEEAEKLDTLKDQNTGATVQSLAEVDELNLTPGGSTESDLQLLREAGSPGTEQAGSADPDVQPLDQVDEEELVEMEAENAKEETIPCGGVNPGGPWKGEGGTAIQAEEEEEEDGAQGQGVCELPQEPVLDPQGAAVGQGEEAGAGVAERLDSAEDQSTDANVQLLTEVDELTLMPGGSTEADLQPSSKSDSLGAEQGGSVDPGVQPLHQVNAAELVELLETENSWIDKQLSGDASPEGPQQEGDDTAMQPEEEAEGWGQGQGEHGLPHEPGLHTLEHQSSRANVRLMAEVDELKLTPAGSIEAGLQLLGGAGSIGKEQRRSVDPDIQPLDQVHEQVLVAMEAEDAQTETQLGGGLSPGAPWGAEGEKATQLEEEEEEEEEEEDGAQGQGVCELPQEPVLDPQGAAVGQGEEAGAGVAERLDSAEDQSTDANVQLLTEVDELKSASGESTEADLQPPGKSDSLGAEQGGSVDPGMQPLHQEDKGELVEMETQDSRTDTELCGAASIETLQEKGDCAAVQFRDEAEDESQGQGGHGLLPDPVLDPQGARARQGAGAGAGVQTGEEAGHLDTLEGQSTGASIQLFTEEDGLSSASGGSTEAGLAPLGAAGRWEGGQSLTPGLGAGLCAAHTADTEEGPAAAHVPPPAEASSYPEPVTAAEGLGVEAKLGAATGPDGQIPEDTQALELPQGERAAAGGMPLDGAQGLEMVQGERLEERMRSGVKTQGLGLHQGHDHGVSALASPVSDVPLQTGTLKLEGMMQEDVLIPDVWKSELQEQVSAQGHQMRIHTPAQQPEGKTPRVMEPEQVAAGPAEPPKQEVPPVSTLPMRAQPQEDAGNNQLGMVLAESSLGDAANLCVQPQRQLLGGQSKGLSVGQGEKPQEFGVKMIQESKPSPGEAKAVTADGAEVASKGCPKAPLDPDHLYNVLFVGDSHVGKTSFLYRLHADSFNPNLSATVGLDYGIKNLVVDNKRFALRLWDSAGQERYHSMTKQFFRKADGVVLMYDITSQYSFSDVRYWLSCIQEGAEEGIAILLLGNKTDCAAQRQVPTKEGECLAKEHQLMFYECSAASGHNVSESMVSFVRLLKVREDELKNKAEEVPKTPQKKKSCCW